MNNVFVTKQLHQVYIQKFDVSFLFLQRKRDMWKDKHKLDAHCYRNYRCSMIGLCHHAANSNKKLSIQQCQSNKKAIIKDNLNSHMNREVICVCEENNIRFIVLQLKFYTPHVVPQCCLFLYSEVLVTSSNGLEKDCLWKQMYQPEAIPDLVTLSTT